MLHRKKGNKVPPKSKELIRNTAKSVREIFHLGNKKINMIKFIEFILPVVMPGFYYEIIQKEYMGEDEARTYPDKKLIQIRSDVYDEAIRGGGRSQFTLAHELGHLVMHAGLEKSPSYARNKQSHEIYEDSEWQADKFAAEFLMPWNEVKKCQSVDEIVEKFCVSKKAANYTLSLINKHN